MRPLKFAILALAALLSLSAHAATPATPAIATGGTHMLALQSDGTVLAWGSNNYGQLGNGQTPYATVPLAVLGVAPAVSLSAGLYYMVSARKDGTVWAWGSDAQGNSATGA